MKRKRKSFESEKPVQIIPSKGRHKTETRVFARNIHEHYCIQPGCKFKGKHAQQGVCFSTKTFNDSSDWSYIDNALETGEKHVKWIRKHTKSMKDRLDYLESELVCMWANWTINLDELIRLRRENALLKLQAEKFKKIRKRS